MIDDDGIQLDVTSKYQRQHNMHDCKLGLQFCLHKLLFCLRTENTSKNDAKTKLTDTWQA